MASVKGVVLLNVREYALARGGAGAWSGVLGRLAPADRQALSAVIPVGWYEVGLYDRLNRALAEALAESDGAEGVMNDLGRFSAEHDLKTIQRMFLRLASPAYVIERSASYWRRFQDSGTWTTHRESPTHVRATLEGWESADPLSCVRLAGYLFRLFQLVGARNGSLDRVACRCRGEPACIFEGHWE